MIKRLLKFFNADGLLRDSSVLFAGMAGVHVLNLVFQMVMGRCLLEQEYALLVTLIGMLNIFMIPLSVISSTINRYSRLLVKNERQGDIRRLVFWWGGRLALVGVVCSMICFLFPDRLASFFHLERSAPILIFGVILTGVFCRPVFDGALMGLQCFKAWSFSSLLGWGLRLAIGTLLVIYVSPHAGWGLLGHGLGFYLALGFGVVFLLIYLRSHEITDQPLPQLHGYVLGSFFVLLGYSVLMTADVVLVKHLYPESAGDFSYAATLGRLVVFVPQAFVAAMFPRVVSDEGGTRAQYHLFIKTLLMTLLTTLSAALLFSVVVSLMLKLIFGIAEPSENLLAWSRMLAWIMVPVALLSVAVRFTLAQKRFGIAAAVPAAAFLYLTLCFRFGNGVGDILLISLGCSLGAVVTMFFYLVKCRGQECA